MNLKPIISVFFLTLCGLVASCSSNQSIEVENKSNEFGEYGIWVGAILQFTTKELEDSSDEQYTVAIMNCGAQPTISIVVNNGEATPIYGDYDISSKSGNYVMQKIIDGGSWIETQVWSFVLLESGQATVQWNRLVSNRVLDDSERLRSFGQIGYGELYKSSNDCSEFD